MADNKNKVMEETKNIDIKNASEYEIKNYAKDVVELSPEDMADVLTGNQKMRQSLEEIVTTTFGYLKDISLSEDADTQQILDMLNKDMDIDAEEDKALRNTEKTVQTEIAKIINNPDMPEDEKKTYIDQWLVYYQTSRDSHNENKNRRKEQTDIAVKEIENKRDRHRRIIKAMCLFGLVFVSGYAGQRVFKKI